MILFNEEKGIVFKITNAVLLIWLVAAVVFLSGSVIEMLVEEPVYTESQYKILNCVTTDSETSKEEMDKQCEIDYTYYLNNNDNTAYNKKISLYTSIANIVIVGATLVVLNIKKQKKA